jgi:membrane protein DedA with SNARE-associated domain
MGALLDGAGLPIPGGVDALVVFLAAQLPAQAMWLATVAVIGSVAGNFILFLIARRGGRAFLDKRSTSARAKRFRHWFDRYGLSTVFVAALVPLPVMPLKIFVLSSGALGSKPIRFLLVFLAARIPRYVGLALLGQAMGNHAMDYLKHHVWHLLGFAVALLALLMIAMRYADKLAATATE